MARGTVVQMVKTVLQDKKILESTTENVARIQISVVIITYCLVAIVQYDMQLYEILQILSISLMDKTPLQELFNKTNFNDVKEQFNPLYSGVG